MEKIGKVLLGLGVSNGAVDGGVRDNFWRQELHWGFWGQWDVVP
jgi:hypothetical protein